MKWSICILTVPERKTDLTRITGILNYQINGREDIELLINDRPGDIGEKRQWCLDNAHGEYINFVDDDDIVAHNYVEAIYPLLDGVDYIGFMLQHYFNGAKSKPTYHSLEYTNWFEDDDGWYRGVSHLNPIRLEVAKQGSFDGTYGEDYRWAQMVQPKTAHFIDDQMYFYFYSEEYTIAGKN